MTNNTNNFIETYAQIMFANLEDIEELTLALETAIDAFLADPTEANLEAARDAWIEARPFYQESEIGRFYDGPIDDEDGPEGAINAWPLDENYIDYVDGDADSGLINDTDFEISEENLRNANEAGGEANIAIGWHAIEFLLWGQDSDPEGPGARPATDYDETSGDATNQDRRRAYLELVVDLLIADLRSVLAEWEPDSEDNYRAELESLSPAEALGRIMTGMGSLAFGELRGERLITPFTVKEQEEEHSCFSDLTHLDHLHDVIGIQSVWLGSYTRSDGSTVEGTGVRDAANGSQSLVTNITAVLARAIASLRSEELNPFDQAILGDDEEPGRVILQSVIDDLSEFNDDFSSLAEELGVDIVTTLQD
ncbi:MAG: imelysin family protein [Planctomycetota bacterium]